MKEIILRFLIGGTFVTAFSFLGDIFRPKSFAGLFGAAPSIALATLALTVATNGKIYAASEAHTMIAGAAGFFLYASAVSWMMMHRNFSALRATVSMMAVWFAGAFGIWFLWFK